MTVREWKKKDCFDNFFALRDRVNDLFGNKVWTGCIFSRDNQSVREVVFLSHGNHRYIDYIDGSSVTYYHAFLNFVVGFDNSIVSCDIKRLKYEKNSLASYLLKHARFRKNFDRSKVEPGYYFKCQTNDPFRFYI